MAKTTRLTIDNKKLYRRYEYMKRRCYNKNNISYKNYGARGLTICKEWLGENGFQNFLNWALSNGYSQELQIDRIDNDKGYNPDNCRWVDRKINMQNRRNSITINGEPLNEIAQRMNVKYCTLQSRYKKYGSIEKPKIKCLECGKEFAIYRSNQKFCSPKCCKRHNRKLKAVFC